MKKTGKNLKYLRENNTNQILKILTIQNESSRIELSKHLGLSKMTITNIASELLEKQYLTEYKASAVELVGCTGPKPLKLALKSERILAIGVYVSRNKMHCALTDMVGTELYVQERQYDINSLEENYLKLVCDCIDCMLAYNETLNQYIIGIGISTTGEVDAKQEVRIKKIGSSEIIKIPVQKIIGERYSYPVFVGNVMNASALAEVIYGHGRKYTDFVAIAITYGIGAAVVSNGRVLKGNRGLGSEISHLSIDYDGEPCACGNRGCLELYTGLYSILKKTGVDNLERLVHSIENGDEKTLAVMDEFVVMMSAALINIVNVFDAEYIILGHEGILFAEKYLERIENYINSRTIKGQDKRIKVMLSAFRDMGGLRGASTLVFNQLFEGNITL